MRGSIGEGADFNPLPWGEGVAEGDG
jgi:hypothetical protein